MNTFEVDSFFWLAIGLIFFATLFGALARRLKRDRCLLLFHTHHVTFLAETKDAITGDLSVTSHGLELSLDVPENQKIVQWRKSVLVYDNEVASGVAMCRVEEGLSVPERQRRTQQTSRLVNPDLWHRITRVLGNLVNIVRDAIIQSVGLFLGKFGSRPGGLQTLAREQSTRLTELSGNVLGLFNNAYEPLLERYIGREVVLTVRVREKPEPVDVEFFGYLADYNERLIALLNPLQRSTEILNQSVVSSLELPGCKVEVFDTLLAVTCTGPAAIVIREIRVAETVIISGVVLLNTFSYRVPLSTPERPHVCLHRTETVDLVCPRSRAVVRNGAASHEGARFTAACEETRATPHA